MRTSAFGLTLRFEGGTPPGAWEQQAGSGPELRVREASEEAVAAAWSGRESVGWEARIDGLPFRVERGLGADHLFLHGDRELCHLDREASTLLCAVTAAEAAGAWRVVLDSVLFSVALLRGLEALHAGAVAGDEGAIALAAPSGGGKSTLLGSLLAEGFELLADDVVALGPGDGRVLANPGPPLMTVPGTAPSPPGEELARIGEERWLAVPVCREAQPLAAVVLLNRRADGPTELCALAEPLRPLLAMMLRFPRTPERERSRFELAATIAESVPVWELRARPTATPASLARHLAGAELQSGQAATNLRRT